VSRAKAMADRPFSPDILDPSIRLSGYSGQANKILGAARIGQREFKNKYMIWKKIGNKKQRDLKNKIPLYL